MELLKTQLILKGVITKDDWEYLQNSIRFEYRKDSYFTEAKENEILTNRLNLVNSADPYLGKYFSKKYIQKSILRMSDDEINDVTMEIGNEKQMDPEGSMPTQVTTQVDTQRLMGDLQNQQQLQAQHDQSVLQQQVPQQEEPKKKQASKK